MTYQAPLRDMRFILDHLVDFEAITALPGCEEVTADLAGAILDEAAKFAAGVLSPLNGITSGFAFAYVIARVYLTGDAVNTAANVVAGHCSTSRTPILWSGRSPTVFRRPRRDTAI